MAQIFRRSTNTIAKASIYGGVFIVAFGIWVFMVLDRSALNTGQGIVVEQPVPFSHDHHTSGLGIDCRYCHTSVEESSFAGVPPTETCMNCHREIWKDEKMLEPVRASYRTGSPIRWWRVYDLPDYVYFDHSIHVAKGVGCASCHGPVDEMPLIYQAASLQMEWCLECHRHPERYVRPTDEIFNMDYQPPEPQRILGPRLVEEYGISTLESCSTCHR